VTEADLLAAWEAALPRSRRERALVLAGVVSDRAGLEDLPLGQVDALLLDLREHCFGPLLDCLVTCPDCGEELDATVGVCELRLPTTQRGDEEVRVGGGRLRVRPVTTRDLRLTGDRGSLVRRCVVEGEVDDEALDRVEGVLDGLDPQAAPTVDLDCPTCRASWTAPFDVAEFVWQEVDRTARRTLHDVQALASAYGWREPDVLALTAVRRRYYLESAGT